MMNKKKKYTQYHQKMIQKLKYQIHLKQTFSYVRVTGLSVDNYKNRKLCYK